LILKISGLTGFPDFPKAQLVNENFFSYQGAFDLIIEQTFFCSMPPLPANRKAYALQIKDKMIDF